MLYPPHYKKAFASSNVLLLPLHVDTHVMSEENAKLEAMKVGLPVATSTVSALPEVAGGCAALADPNSVADLTKTMHTLLMDEDMRQEFKDKGPDQARAFTWERNAERYLELYQKVCKA